VETAKLIAGIFLIVAHSPAHCSVGALLACAEISAMHFTVSPTDLPLTGKLFAADQGLVSYQGATSSFGLVPGLTPLLEIKADELARSGDRAADISLASSSSQILKSRLIDPAKIKPGPIAYLGLGLIALALMRQYLQQPRILSKLLRRWQKPQPRYSETSAGNPPGDF
jgi:hypothetical protein